jgi:putative ABC transport system permease protein
MFWNYLRIAFRGLYQQKVFSIINISGLAIGISASLIIVYFIMDEINYDRFHKDYQRIYLLLNRSASNASGQWDERMPAPLLTRLNEQFPQIETAVHFTSGGDIIISIGDEKYLEKNSYQKVSSDFFELFTFKFIGGHSGNIILDPGAVLISQDLALKYFHTTLVTGEIIHFNGQDWKIKAVFENLPQYTHLPKTKIVTQFDYQSEKWFKNWDGVPVPTYIKVKNNSGTEAIAKRILQTVSDNAPAIVRQTPDLDIKLIPIEDIHLNLEPESIKRKQNIFIFSNIGILILLISSLNFINLSTARSLQRARSVVIRKINGSSRLNLIGQFLTEALVVGMLATMLAIILTEWLGPFLSEITGRNILFSRFGSFRLLIISLGLILFSGLFAGLFPAILMSSFNPLQIIQGQTIKGIKRTKLRHMLVLVQFVISICLVVASLVISGQVNYMQNSETGFDKKSMLILPTQNSAMADVLSRDFELVKARFENHPDVLSVSGHLDTPGRMHHQDMFSCEGKGKEQFRMHLVFVDPEFTDTYKISCINGRGFNREMVSDRSNTFVINQAASKQFGFSSAEEALGKKISFWGGTGEIIGVTPDFNFASLHQAVEPLVLQWPKFFIPEMMTLKLKTADIQRTLAEIKSIWISLYPDNPFDYYFLEDDILSSYRSDRIFRGLILMFTGLAMFIACLGILGLSIYDSQLRKKEICIRRVMGCSLSSIVRLLTLDLCLGIVVAGVIAWPVSCFAMNKWLQNFAFRIDLTVWPFFIAGFAALIIALLTVSWQAVRAATANPVEALRYE